MSDINRKRVAVAVFVVFLFFLSSTVFTAAWHCSCSGSSGEYSWPVRGKIIREFKKPAGPYGSGGHQGVDIEASTGVPVLASGNGRVIWVGEVPRGKFVSISHPGGIKTTYLDMLDIAVKSGENVHKGQRIGTVYGYRDSSSSACHLHFSTSQNGTPVNPRLIIDEIDEESFIRLCPITQDITGDPHGPLPEKDGTGIFSRLKSWAGDLFSGFSDMLGEAFSSMVDIIKSIGDVLIKPVVSMLELISDVWDDYLFPVLAKIGEWIADAALWIWNNPYVQAALAGILAALVVVAAVVAAALTLGVSLAITVAAAVTASIASIGTAVYSAVASGGEFSFAACFWQSVTAGIIAGTFVLSLGSLSGTMSAGFAKLGISGITKSAITNGVFSAVFDASSSYLLTGAVSWKNVLVAFGIGALAGGLTSALKAGLAPRKVLQLLKIGFGRASTKVISLGSSISVGIKQSVQTVTVLFLSVKDVAASAAAKAAYIIFSGSFGASVNVLTCVFTGREISLESVIASFISGSLMGAVSLSFGVKGVQGLLLKFKVFQVGFGRHLGRYIAKGVEKVISKAFKHGFEKGFRKIFRWKEV